MSINSNHCNENHKILDIGYVLESYRCLSTHSDSKVNILSLKKHEIVFILDISKKGWLDVININEGKTLHRGWFPQNYVKIIHDVKIKNLHFSKLSNLLFASDSSSTSFLSPSFNGISSPDSSTVNKNKKYATHTTVNSDPMETIDPLSTWSFTDHNDKNKNKNKNIVNHTNRHNSINDMESLMGADFDLLKDYKLCSRKQIEKDFYDQLLLSNDKTYKTPILWQIMENDHSRAQNKTRKLIYYNRALKIYCYELPILIHQVWDREKLDSMVNSRDSKLYLAKNDTFISNPNDSISISDIFENVLYCSSLLKRALLTRDKLIISKYLKSISLTVAYITLIMRHFEPFFLSSVKKELRQLLKSILKYSSLIKLNANIHCTKEFLHSFSNYNRNVTTENKLQPIRKNNQGTYNAASDAMNTDASLCFTKLSGYNHDRNDSITTSETIVSNNTLIKPPSSYNAQFYNRNTSVSSIYSKNSTIDLSPRRTSATLINVETLQRSTDLMFAHIESLQNSVQLLFYLINNCVNLPGERALTLPQLFPRFFIDSNGKENWSNLIVNHLITSDSVTTMSTVDGLFSKKSVTSLSSMTSSDSVHAENVVDLTVSQYLKDNLQQTSNENEFSVANLNDTMFKSKPFTALSSNINISGKSSSYFSAPTSASSSFLGMNSNLSFNRSGSTNNLSGHCNLVPKKRTEFRNKIYPLNRDTLNIMRAKQEAMYNNMRNFMISTADSKPSINEVLKVYTELNDHNITIYIVEHLDLTFFANLKSIIENGDPNDENIKLLNHSTSNIMLLINNYLEVKQWFHDIFIELTMVTQEVTLEDSKVFKSMLPFRGVGSMETIQIDDLNFSRNGFQENKDIFKDDRFAMHFYEQLVRDDVDAEAVEVLNLCDKFRYVYSKYYDINCMAYSAVEKLLEEKERIINYCARTMQDPLIVELQKGEFNDTEWSESNFIKELSFNPAVVNRAGSYDDISPWYLKPDSEAPIVLDQTGRNIKFATRDALINYLLFSHCDGSIDTKFMHVFLLTFKSVFSSTTEMLLAIIDKYHLKPPEGLTYNEYTEWTDKKLLPIKKNIVKILDEFLKRYWTSAYWEPNLELILMEMSNQIETENIDGSDQLFDNIKRVIRNCKKGIVHDPREALNFTNQILVPSRGAKNLKLSNITSAQFAQQITLMNHEMYCNISIFECLDKIWGKQKNCSFGGSKNISKFIEHANFMTNYVAYEIVNQTDIKKRVKVINYFISVALHCQKLCNFATLTAILSGLYSSPIYRLKKTWNEVSDESKEILQKLDHLMDSKKNFLNYRMCLKSIPEKVACVPFFGVYLSDLTFADTGNQDSSEMINFHKRVMIYDIISNIESFQKRTYSSVLAKNKDIQMFILESLEDVPDLDKQYRLSLQIEPRDTSKTQKRTKTISSTKLWKNRPGMKLFG